MGKRSGPLRESAFTLDVKNLRADNTSVAYSDPAIGDKKPDADGNETDRVVLQGDRHL